MTLDCINDAIGARLDHLRTVCNHLAQSNAARSSIVVTTPSRPTTTQSRNIDRSMNGMQFGMSEDKDAPVWRGKADRALEFTAVILSTLLTCSGLDDFLMVKFV